MSVSRSFFISILLLAACIVPGQRGVHAAGLEIVFKDTLWGGAIGAVVGLAGWSLDGINDESQIGKTVLRGAAIGVFGGMLYGFYDAQKMGYSAIQPSPGIFHYNSQQDRLQLNLGAATAQVAAIVGKTKQLSLFTAEF